MFRIHSVFETSTESVGCDLCVALEVFSDLGLLLNTDPGSPTKTLPLTSNRWPIVFFHKGSKELIQCAILVSVLALWKLKVHLKSQGALNFSHFHPPH